MIENYIYFIRCGRDGPIKIGTAAQPKRRLIDLQISHWQKLSIIATIKGTPKQEKEWHERFRGFKIRGEWFWPVPSLLKRIEEATEFEKKVGDKAPYTSPLREFLGMPPKSIKEIS